MSITKTARWVLKSQHGLDSLVYEQETIIPDIGVEEVLVELHAASLNYRDLVISTVCLANDPYISSPTTNDL
jgi:NADPH:quinone reductase-like Zn-dependent oxidoreductase